MYIHGADSEARNGQMNDLFEWDEPRGRKRSPSLIMSSSVFHYEFVFIHPFGDGNGRMARLWQTTLLYDWRELFSMYHLRVRLKTSNKASIMK